MPFIGRCLSLDRQQRRGICQENERDQLGNQIIHFRRSGARIKYPQDSSMKRLLLFILTCFSIASVQAQDDWSWWNETHGWEPGMPGWRSFIVISPGYLGPNALPVPDVAKGLLETAKSVKLSFDLHFREGDPTQNLAGRFYYPFSDKIGIELYGVLFEHYAMSNVIRDERAARDRDGRGVAIGDLYFGTHIQLVKDRKFPNTLVRMVAKTASGRPFDAARYSDSPGYYFDFSFSKQIPQFMGGLNGLPFASFGFYSWQTNDMNNLQNDAFMFSAGFEFNNEKWRIANSVSGYSGYKNERDQPAVYTFSAKRELRKNALQFQYICGLHDWKYQTIKLAYLWQWK